MINLLIFSFLNCDFCVICKKHFLIPWSKKCSPNFLWSILKFCFTFTFKTIWILFLHVMWNMGRFFLCQISLFSISFIHNWFRIQTPSYCPVFIIHILGSIWRLSICAINPFVYTCVVLIMNTLWILIFVRLVIVHSLPSLTPTPLFCSFWIVLIILALCSLNFKVRFLNSKEIMLVFLGILLNLWNDLGKNWYLFGKEISYS